MTLAISPQNPTVITLLLRDINAREIKKEFFVPVTVWDPATDLLADLYTIRNTLVTEFAPISTALIYRTFVTLGQTDDTDTFGPAGSDLTDAASLVLNLSSAGKQASYILPSPNIGVFVGDTGKNRNIVDVADADLLAFVELMSLTDGSFVISDGESVTDTGAEQVSSGKRIARKIKAPKP